MARVGPLTKEERHALIEADVQNRRKYAQEVLIEGAFERIQAMNSVMGNLTDKVSDVKEWLGIGRKDN
jgi:hypothetical protein